MKQRVMDFLRNLKARVQMPVVVRPDWLTWDNVRTIALYLAVMVAAGSVGYKLHTLDEQVALQQRAIVLLADNNRLLVTRLAVLEAKAAGAARIPRRGR